MEQEVEVGGGVVAVVEEGEGLTVVLEELLQSSVQKEDSVIFTLITTPL